MKTKQQGFTLIELVVVIVILGILAATAIPRYVNYTSQARIAALNGVTGAINSAVAIAQGRYISLGTNPATITAIDGTTVAVDNTTTPASAGGLPLATTAGICNGVSVSGFACVNGTFDFSPSIANCNVVYAHTAATTTFTVTATTSGC